MLQNERFLRPLLLFCAFFSGLSVMVLEMSFSRLLAPVFGNSLYVWTNVIGLVMLSLCVGYFLGGIWSDARGGVRAYFYSLFFAGCFAFAVPFLLPFVSNFFLASSSNLAYSSAQGSFLITAIFLILPMVYLGMILPFTVKLLNPSTENLGRTSGLVSSFSSLGSLIGTFLPAFLLIPVFGSSATFAGIGICLMTLGLLWLRSFFIFLLWLFALAISFNVPSIDAGVNVINQKESPYGFIFVSEDEDERRYLHMDSSFGVQSIYDPQTPITRGYYPYVGALPDFMFKQPESALLLGHAGGSFTRLFNSYHPYIKVTGVELDPMVTEVARQSMHLEDLDVDLRHMDARHFLNVEDGSFDLIVLDAYHLARVPSHLATLEFFNMVKSHLNEGGVFAFNLASAQGEFYNTILDTLAASFPNVWILPIPNTYNTVIFASIDEAFAFEPLRDVDPELSDFAAFIRQNLRPWQSLGEAVFRDDFSYRVDLLNEKMLQSLY